MMRRFFTFHASPTAIAEMSTMIGSPSVTANKKSREGLTSRLFPLNLLND